MTLKGPNDFKLEDFYSASSELFEPYYGKDTEEEVNLQTVLCGDSRSEAVIIHWACFLYWVPQPGVSSPCLEDLGSL